MIEIKIQGLSCQHCVRAVSEALAAVPGVTAVREVSLERGVATVDGTPTPEALVAAIRDAGYQAEPLG
jgi:copper chaperone